MHNIIIIVTFRPIIVFKQLIVVKQLTATEIALNGDGEKSRLLLQAG